MIVTHRRETTVGLSSCATSRFSTQIELAQHISLGNPYLIEPDIDTAIDAAGDAYDNAVT